MSVFNESSLNDIRQGAFINKSINKPAALRQAQLSLKAMPEYSHPFSRAPFVMIGDWR